jgi:hypothetical protein
VGRLCITTSMFRGRSRGHDDRGRLWIKFDVCYETIPGASWSLASILSVVYFRGEGACLYEHIVLLIAIGDIFSF